MCSMRAQVLGCGRRMPHITSTDGCADWCAEQTADTCAECTADSASDPAADTFCGLERAADTTADGAAECDAVSLSEPHTEHRADSDAERCTIDVAVARTDSSAGDWARWDMGTDTAADTSGPSACDSAADGATIDACGADTFADTHTVARADRSIHSDRPDWGRLQGASVPAGMPRAVHAGEDTAVLRRDRLLCVADTACVPGLHQGAAPGVVQHMHCQSDSPRMYQLLREPEAALVRCGCDASADACANSPS